MTVEGLRTADALQYVKLDRTFWNSVVQRQVRKDLPIAQPGRAGRLFDVDDLVAMQFFAELLGIGVIVNIAGHVADDLRAKLRSSRTIEKLHLVTAPNEAGVIRPMIVKKPPPDVPSLWILDIALARKMARATIAELNSEDDS